MPVVLLGIPVAIALAWFALKGGQAGGLRNVIPSTSAGEALEPGATSRLGGRDPEKPFERHELEYAGLPYMYGGEVGGVYGPESQAQAPSAPVEGYAEQPGPTQTYVMEGRLPDPGPTQWQGHIPQPVWQANVATYPTSPYMSDPTQGAIPYGGVTSPAPAPAPKPVAGAGRYGGFAA